MNFLTFLWLLKRASKRKKMIALSLLSVLAFVLASALHFFYLGYTFIREALDPSGLYEPLMAAMPMDDPTHFLMMSGFVIMVAVVLLACALIKMVMTSLVVLLHPFLVLRFGGCLAA